MSNFEKKSHSFDLVRNRGKTYCNGKEGLNVKIHNHFASKGIFIIEGGGGLVGECDRGGRACEKNLKFE